MPLFLSSRSSDSTGSTKRYCFSRRNMAHWLSRCGMLQQFLTHIQIMQYLFGSTQLSYWVRHSPTWLQRRYEPHLPYPPCEGKKRKKKEREWYLLVWCGFQVAQFVNGMFDTRNDLSAFKDRIRDFLVQSKEFSAQVSTYTNLFFLANPLFWFLLWHEIVCNLSASDPPSCRTIKIFMQRKQLLWEKESGKECSLYPDLSPLTRYRTRCWTLRRLILVGA